jgi:hypothetical protein
VIEVPEPEWVFGDQRWRCKLADVRLDDECTINVETSNHYGSIEEAEQLIGALQAAIARAKLISS